MQPKDSILNEGERLRMFWEKRYKTFDLRESGIKGLSPLYNELYYKCKQQAYLKALKFVKISHNDQIRILDAGAGQGFFVRLARKVLPAAEYIGMDISRNAISHLRESFPAYSWHCGDFTESIQEESESFHLVQCIEVLHLILNDRAYEGALREFARVLKPGGVAIITEVFPVSRLAPNSYICFRRRAWLYALYKNVGLRPVKVFPMYYFLPDRGPRIKYIYWIFCRLDARLVYLADRLALSLQLPQIRQNHDSRMKMVVLKKL